MTDEDFDPRLPATASQSTGMDPSLPGAFVDKSIPRGQRLRFRFSNPANGWLDIEVTAGEQRFIAAISYTPNDFVSELTTAGNLVAEGQEAVALAHVEPGGFEFAFRPTGASGLLFEILSYANMWLRRPCRGENVFSVQTSIPEACLALWRGLRSLEGAISADGYREAMRWEFPTSIVRRLGERFGK